MVEKWIISPTYKWLVYWGEITPLTVLTMDPNFLGHRNKYPLDIRCILWVDYFWGPPSQGFSHHFPYDTVARM